MSKQYIVEHAYDMNYSITKYSDGEYEGQVVLATWEMDGYIYALEEQGYTKAYNVDDAEEAMKKAKEDYDYAVEFLKVARNNALIKANRSK